MSAAMSVVATLAVVTEPAVSATAAAIRRRTATRMRRRIPRHRKWGQIPLRPLWKWMALVRHEVGPEVSFSLTRLCLRFDIIPSVGRATVRSIGLELAFEPTPDRLGNLRNCKLTFCRKALESFSTQERRVGRDATLSRAHSFRLFPNLVWVSSRAPSTE